MEYTVSFQVQQQLTVFPAPLEESQMTAGGVQDQGLFTDSYCRVCSAQLISLSQRLAHYQTGEPLRQGCQTESQEGCSVCQSRKHANKVRLYYMLHPKDGGCPAKKLRTDSGSEDADVDRNKCCTLCNMSFTSAVVAESHYQGKIHAKRLKLLLGDSAVPSTGAGEPRPPYHLSLRGTCLYLPETPPSPASLPPDVTTAALPWQQQDSDRFCQLCSAWFNNSGMARQHYDGKKHKKNAGHAHLLERLGQTLGVGKAKGLKRSHTCEVCSVTLNSVAQYHAHLQGSKHQNNLKNQL